MILLQAFKICLVLNFEGSKAGKAFNYWVSDFFYKYMYTGAGQRQGKYRCAREINMSS